MKKAIDGLKKYEKGHVIILVTVLMLVGGLIASPLLAYMSSGINSGRIYEKRTYELYSADAGVNHAIWTVIKADGLPGDGDDPLGYNVPDVNDKMVNVSIKYIDEETFKVTAISNSTDGSNTIIESYIKILWFPNFLDQAITGVGDIDLKPGTVVNGDVKYNGTLDNQGTINGDISTDEIAGWPTTEDISDYYWDFVAESLPMPYPEAFIDVNTTNNIGPLYQDGDLEIKTTDNGESATLNGTVYVTGNLTFTQSGKDYEIDLNGQTIFCEGAISFPSYLCTLTGSGAIIAVGDIDFQPAISSDADDFIFVMSLEGEIDMNPNGDFYGSLAGNTGVNLQPGSTITWREPPQDLNLPGQVGNPNVIEEISTWEISSS
jgi:hypothetical protein